MKARLLKALNGPGLLLIALAMMTLQSTLLNSYPWLFFLPDGVLCLVLWIGMKRDFMEGGILALCLGYLEELHSGAPRGLFLTHSMMIFLMVHFLNYQFQVMTKRTLILVGAGGAVLSRLLILFLLNVFNHSENEWQYTLRLLAPSAIIHGALFPFIYQFLHRYDFWTLKSPQAEHQHERDFYLDNELL